MDQVCSMVKDRAMKILITGGAGFIGSALIRMAISRGHSIINVDKLTYAGNLQNVMSIAQHPNYKFENLDICDAPAMEAIFKIYAPDAVMHLAAESHVDRSIDAPAAFIQTNVIGTFNLLSVARDYWNGLDASRRDNFRFHHVSTDEVYGDLEVDADAFEETSPYLPSSPYSASKAASDHLVRAWGRTYGLPVIISNCSNNYGPYQFPEKLIPVVILKAIHEQDIPVYGTGKNIRDWLYVDDHADALLTVLKDGKLGQTYNIGGQNERTNLDIVTTICQLIDARGINKRVSERLIRFVNDRPGHDFRYAINAEKIKTDLNWEPSVKWDAGFEKTIDWYLNNRDWWAPLMTKAIYGDILGQRN